MRKDFLLGCVNGEILMMEHLFLLTEKNIYTKKPQWCISTPEFDINPFGKLLKQPASYGADGKVKIHAKHYHGYYMNLNCTEEFYERYKPKFDEFIIVEEHILRDSQPPVWL